MKATVDIKKLVEQRVIAHDRQLVCCRFSPDGEHLFATGFDGKLHRWHLTSDAHQAFAAEGGWLESIALHPDGERFYTADSWGQLRCWPTSGAELAPRWTVGQASGSWLRRMVISPNGEHLATCGNDRMVRVFSSSDGKLIQQFAGHEHCVQSVAFAADGVSLVSGDQHGVVKHWDIASGKRRRDLDASSLFKVYYQYEQGGARVLTFDGAGKTLYCGGFEGSNANQAHGAPTVLAFDWESGQLQRTMKTKVDFKGPIVDMAHHPAGFLIGAGSSEGGGVLWFWKDGDSEDSHTLKNPTSFRSLDLGPRGDRLATTAFGDRGGQRGGNGRRLTKDGEYLGFAGSIVLYAVADPADGKEAKAP